MINLKNAKRMRRGLLSALVLSASLISLVAMPAGHVAMAKENGGHGNGGGHGGGNGGGHGGGNGGQSAGRSGETHGSSHAGPNADASNGGAQTADATDDTDDTDDGDSLSPSGLGKLNGFMHASPTGLANASPNSSIGRISQTFRDALAAFNAANEEAAPEDPNAPPADPTTDPTTGPTVEDLGGILAGATNKPVTAEQVQAIADRLAEVNDDPSLGDLSDEDAQGIADAANGVETSDAGDDTDTTTQP